MSPTPFFIFLISSFAITIAAAAAAVLVMAVSVAGTIRKEAINNTGKELPMPTLLHFLELISILFYIRLFLIISILD